tara:strand:- start:611 stop:934 length:324 start_codon:yes stop_codon:yes gene_type:complete
MTEIKSFQDICIVFTTESNQENAKLISNLLLKERLIACVTFKEIESHFWWNGQINQSKEVQLMIKCTKDNIDNVCKKISEHHTYDVPEIIYFNVSTSQKYFNWLSSV